MDIEAEQATTGWVVKRDGYWLPGIYENELTALFAAEHFSPWTLKNLGQIWEADGEDRPVTMTDLAVLL